jgi:transcriptional regulator with XRE-family HTH domain
MRRTKPRKLVIRRVHTSGASGNTSGIDTKTFASTAGRVLRDVRTGRRLSLRQVAIRSGGRFKPSSVASYERGERQLSLERLFSLSEVYGIEPERIVAAIAHRLGGQEDRLDRDDVTIVGMLTGTRDR